MTVEDVYSFDEDDLFYRAEESEYWANFYMFYSKVKFIELEQLTSQQRAWLEDAQMSIDSESNVT